jgi:hypothetical protein
MPTTSAALDFLDRIGWRTAGPTIRETVLAIESEARQQEREALAERIEGLGPDHGQDDPCVCTPAGLRAAVLSILRGEKP